MDHEKPVQTRLRSSVVPIGKGGLQKNERFFSEISEYRFLRMPQPLIVEQRS